MTSPAPTGGVLILGATGGIGSALARQLAHQKTPLFLVGRDSARLDRIASELGAERLAGDVTQPGDVEAIFQQATTSMGRVQGVAHCVGSILLKPAHLTRDEEWADVLRVNLTSAFHITRAAARHMGEHGGSVVLVSSCAALRGLALHEAIAAAKAGIVGLALSAAATYARQGLRFNCVAPGLTRTPLTASLTDNPATLRHSLALHPLGRIGEPDDVASAIRWLLSPESSWITGQVLSVDGGLAHVQPRT